MALPSEQTPTDVSIGSKGSTDLFKPLSFRRRLNTIKIPPSRRRLTTINRLSQVLFYTIIAGGMFAVTFGILHTAISFLGTGVLGILFGFFGAAFGALTLLEKTHTDVRIFIFFIFFIILGELLMLVVTSVKFAATNNLEFPRGCLNAPEATAPDDISVTCKTHAVVWTISAVFLSLSIGAFTFSMLIAWTLKNKIVKLMFAEQQIKNRALLSRPSVDEYSLYAKPIQTNLEEEEEGFKHQEHKVLSIDEEAPRTTLSAKGSLPKEPAASEVVKATAESPSQDVSLNSSPTSSALPSPVPRSPKPPISLQHMEFQEERGVGRYGSRDKSIEFNQRQAKP